MRAFKNVNYLNCCNIKRYLGVNFTFVGVEGKAQVETQEEPDLDPGLAKLLFTMTDFPYWWEWEILPETKQGTHRITGWS